MIKHILGLCLRWKVIALAILLFEIWSLAMNSTNDQIISIRQEVAKHTKGEPLSDIWKRLTD